MSTVGGYGDGPGGHGDGPGLRGQVGQLQHEDHHRERGPEVKTRTNTLNTHTLQYR